MFDTMTLTKAFGSLCATFLVFLLAGWAASSIYYTGGGHGEHAEKQAYVIDTGEAEVTEVAEEGPLFAEVLASADAGAGERVFAKCAACHKVDNSNGTGPHLNGVVGRAKAAVEGFSYSEAILAVKDQSWTPENLDGFLKNPKGYMPGTKMSFAGLPKVEDRANLVAWLETQK
jgi:cytochrome c